MSEKRDVRIKPAHGFERLRRGFLFAARRRGQVHLRDQRRETFAHDRVIIDHQDTFPNAAC